MTSNFSLSTVVRMLARAKAAGDLQLFQKSCTIEVRLAQPGERITTIVRGVVETENTTGDDDVVVRNPTATEEQYNLTREDFLKRYTAAGELGYDSWVSAEAHGFAYAMVYKGQAFWFETKWGNKMLVEYNDRLAVSDQEDLEGVYRIEKTAFLETYAPVGGTPKAAEANMET